MSMSTYIDGFIEPDADYVMKAEAWKACKAAGLRPPDELIKLFDGNEPQASGMKVDITSAVRPYKGRDESGFEVEIDKLPKGVRIVRFTNSW